MVDADIIYLLKHRRASEIPFISQDMQKQDYPRNFVVFIDMMLKKYHIKRKSTNKKSSIIFKN